MADATPPPINHDGNWKMIIKELFPDFIAFFLPTLYKDIDWSCSPEYFDKELNQLLTKNAKKGDQEGDLLAKITLNNNGQAKLLAQGKDQSIKEQQKGKQSLWLLIHIEVQSYFDGKFDERMFTYYYRIWDEQRQPITALAIFTTPYMMPTAYQQHTYGTDLHYKYNTYWLKDQDEQELLASKNVFALVVLAALYALKTKNKAAQRFKFKKELAKLLINSGYPVSKRITIFRFLENILALSPPSELQFKSQITAIMETQLQYNPTPDQVFFANRLYEIYHGETIDQRIKREVKQWQLKLQEEATKHKEEKAKRKKEEAKRKEEEAKRKEVEQELREQEEQLKKTTLTLYQDHQLSIEQIASTLNQTQEVIENIITSDQEEQEKL